MDSLLSEFSQHAPVLSRNDARLATPCPAIFPARMCIALCVGDLGIVLRSDRDALHYVGLTAFDGHKHLAPSLNESTEKSSETS